MFKRRARPFSTEDIYDKREYIDKILKFSPLESFGQCQSGYKAFLGEGDSWFYK